MAAPSIISGTTLLFNLETVNGTFDTFDTAAAVPSTNPDGTNNSTIYDSTHTRIDQVSSGHYQLQRWIDSTNTYYSLGMPIASTDFSDEFSILAFAVVIGSPVRGKSIADYGIPFTLQDSNGNWSEYVTHGIDSETDGIVDPTVLKTSIIDPRSGSYNRTSGTLDTSAITRISGAFFNTQEFSINYRLASLYKLGVFTIENGEISSPVTFTGIVDLITSTVQEPMSDIAQSFGSSQKRFMTSFQLGNGDSTPFYFKDSFKSIEFRAGNEISDKETRMNITSGTYGMLFNPTSNYLFNINSCTITSFTPWVYRVLDTANTSQTLTVRGCNIFNAHEVTLNAPANHINTLFDDCAKVVLNDSNMNNCTISNSKSTTGAISYNGTSTTFTNMVFESNDVDIEILATAPTNVDFSNFKFTISPGDVNIIDRRSGTVTITVEDGNTPTFRNEGGGTTTLSAPLTTYDLEFPNIVDGSRVQIFNLTDDTELTNSVVSGGSGFSEQYVAGTDYTAGDTGRYRIACQDGVTSKIPIEGTFTFSAVTATNSIPISQEDDLVYNAFGVDGSTITEFIWDSANIQVDINDASNDTQVQRLAAWYSYFITTATGIDEAFGGIDWETLNSVRINSSVVNITLDNTKATPLLLLGGRLYRTDGNTIIASTSNSIQIDYSPVYTIQTGISGLTPQESAKLDAIAPDLEVINNGVKKASLLIPHDEDL